MGDGLLAASVAGSVFASPSTEQVRYAIETRVPKGKGVCVVVMNYTVSFDCCDCLLASFDGCMGI